MPNRARPARRVDGSSRPVVRLPWRRGLRAALRALTGRIRTAAGGAVRLRVIVLLAAVEALASADQGTVGALATQLERSLHISNAQVGVIAAVAALAGGVGTLPAGLLTDRVHRVRLLWLSIVLWSGAMIASAFAPSFGILVLTRVALGAVTATAGPTIASLTGDFFPARERARIWGLILTGELIGAGVGVVVSGDLANALSWRFGFAWLAIPGLLLALAIAQLLVEPARGGQSRLEPGAQHIVAADEATGDAASDSPEEMLEGDVELAHAAVREQHEDPHPELVLHEDPVRMPLWRSVRYVLKVRTNVVLIVASALGYLFFAGVQTFAVLLLRSRFHLSQPTASALLMVVGVGALAGVVGAGRLADRLLSKGRLNARVLVGAVGYLAAAGIFVPALLSPVLLVTMPLLVLAAGALAAPDPALNAARLEIMHPRLWGRAEGVRTVLRMIALAVGPLLLGLVSQLLGGPSQGGSAATSGANGAALAYAFLIMLVPLAIGGMILLRARRTYPRDVATAAASIEATCEQPAAEVPARA